MRHRHINIEYQLIAQLPQILSERGVTLHKSDAVTLYCRSGRRSVVSTHCFCSAERGYLFRGFKIAYES
jgi:rhodanese-related sulfurtransferase